MGSVTTLYQFTKPWRGEPNRKRFEAYGYPCLILRNRVGCLCGYVGIPKHHPLYMKSYDDEAMYLRVHGGVTFAEFGDGELRPANSKWWIGFDCGHYMDVVPGFFDLYKRIEAEQGILLRAMGRNGEQYRDMKYVTQECIDLAKQLREIQNKAPLEVRPK